METILATAFGRNVDIQRGEADELTKAAHSIFQQLEEGQLTSGDMLTMLFSKLLTHSLSLSLSLLSLIHI